MRSARVLAAAAVLVLAAVPAQAIQTVQVYVNGTPVVAEVPARIVAGRTFLPLRAVAEALGVEVGWDAASRTVLLADPRAPGYYRGPDLPLVPQGREPAPADAPAAAGIDPAALVQVTAADGQGLVARRAGEEVWRVTLPGMAADRLAVAEGAAYLAFRDGQGAHLLAVDAFTGERLWRRELAAPVTALLVWGEVTLAAAGNHVYAFAGPLGRPVAWAAEAGFPQPVTGLVRRDDALYVVLADGQAAVYRAAAPAGDLRIRLGGRLLYPDVAPFIEGGRTLVPLRVIAEGLGARVSFDPETMTVRVDRREELAG